MLGAAVAGLAANRAPASNARTFTVGLAIQGELEDHGLDQLAYQGLVRAEQQLGVKARVLRSTSSAGTARNLAAFARQGFDLVVSVGQPTADAVAAVARRFPETPFTVVDADQRTLAGRPRNVTGIVFDEREIGYLAGYLAALSARRRDANAHAIGAVGGARDPHAARLFAGYRAGARRAVPGIRVLRDAGEADADRATCKRLALAQIRQGSSVVLGASGPCGRGALDAARQGNAWGIRVDADESAPGSSVLTSTVKGADVAVLAAVRSLVGGRLEGGHNLAFGLAGGGVRLGPVSSRAAPADVNATRRIERQLAGGASTDVTTAPGG